MVAMPAWPSPVHSCKSRVCEKDLCTGVSVSTLAFLWLHWTNSSRGAAEWPGALGGQGDGSSLGDLNTTAQTSVRQAHKAVTTWLPLCTEPLSSAIPTLAVTSRLTTMVPCLSVPCLIFPHSPATPQHLPELSDRDSCCPSSSWRPF